MGTFHHGFAIAVSSYNHDKAEAAFAAVRAFARSRADEDFPLHAHYERLLVGPIESIANFSQTYFMAPDGSKEGWRASDLGDEIRDFFVKTMEAADCEVVEGSWGELTPTFSAMED